MNMHSVRRNNLRALIAQQTQSSVAAFGRMFDLDESRLSQLLSDTYRAGNNFGEKAARSLEQKIGLAPLALDALDPCAPPPLSIGAILPRSRQAGTEDTYDVAIYNVAPSIGNSLSMPEHEDVVLRMKICARWLKSHVKFSRPDNLSLITVFGDSMEGTFSEGDTLLVDRGVNDIKIDAVYVLSLNDGLYIKRLQRRPDGAILMISDNKRYDPYVIKHDERDMLHVLGRVLLVWNAHKL